MKNKNKINIVPNTSLWMKLGRTKYNIPKALSELIDNSLDNMVDNKVNVDIHFKIDGDYIGILDNAKGMNIETLTRALTIAEHIEDGMKIGEHGFGLEAATSYLGKNLEIYTKTDEMDKFLKFHYNQEEFLQNNKWEVEYEYIEPENLEEVLGFTFDRGTYIRVENLNVRLYKGLVSSKKDYSEGTIVSKFQSIYKKFIERGILKLNLHVENKKGVIEHIEITPPVKQNLTFKVNFDFTINNNGRDLKASGWVGVLDFYDENIKNKKKYTSGFDVISKNKVILQHLHLGYSYHPEKRLVLGEIELENFQTTSDKTDFIRNSDWQSLELTLNQYIIKPALHIASTSYLNNICNKVGNNEDFNINDDFESFLSKNALNVVSQEIFARDLKPATLTQYTINIESETFEDSKEEIVEYMRVKYNDEQEKKRLKEEEALRNSTNTLSSVDSDFINNEYNLQDNEDEQDVEVQVENENTVEIDCNITFKHNGLIITHKLEELENGVKYNFEFNSSLSKVTVISNKLEFNSLYRNIQSFCLSNIIESIIDTSIVVTSEEAALDPITLSRIRTSVESSFKGNLNIFEKYNNLAI